MILRDEKGGALRRTLDKGAKFRWEQGSQIFAKETDQSGDDEGRERAGDDLTGKRVEENVVRCHAGDAEQDVCLAWRGVHLIRETFSGR